MAECSRLIGCVLLRPHANCGPTCWSRREGIPAGFAAKQECKRFLREKFGLLAGAADRQAIDPQRGLAHTDGNALAILAASTNTIIQLQIVPDHAHAREHIRSVADEGRALQRRTE